MKAVLLAAGLGSRLVPLTHTIPKCLVPFDDRPLLDMWLCQCFAGGIEHCIVNTHHHADTVAAMIRARPYAAKVTIAYEPLLRGTAGTLLHHRAVLEERAFFVAHADNVSAFSMERFIAAHTHRPENCVITMMLFQTPTPQSCGIVQCDEHGVVQQFYEKHPNPPGNLANGAVYIMEPTIFSDNNIWQKTMPDISLDIIPHYKGRIATYENILYHRDIGTPESYAQATQHFPSIKKYFPV